MAGEWNSPVIHPSAWIAPNATIVGQVSVGCASSVWYAAVVRADFDCVDIGDSTNIQDGAVVHADPGFPVTIGQRVTVGHRAVLHGCTVEDDAVVGMGSVVMNGAIVGAGAVIAAGTVVLERTRVPPNTLAVGVPARFVREVTESERAGMRENASSYCQLAARHAAIVGNTD